MLVGLTADGRGQIAGGILMRRRGFGNSGSITPKQGGCTKADA